MFTESSLAANAVSSAFQTCACAEQETQECVGEAGRQIGFPAMKSKLPGKKRRRQASIYAAIFHLFMTQEDHICLPAC